MERVLRLGVLNVVTQPHSADRYQRLIQRVKRRNKAGRIRGDRFGVIGTLGVPDDPKAPGAYLQGTITTFTQIDVDGDWVNVSTGEKAEEDERKQINIPAHLRPNPAYHHFRFYLKEHILIFEIGNSSRRLTPVNSGKLFERLFSAASIVKDFGEVAVTVWPDKNAINSILNDKGLRSLHLVIYAPNPDDAKDAEARFTKRLEAMGARSIEQKVQAKKDVNFKPDAELIEAARVAATNGSVDALIRQGHRTRKVSTIDTPLIYSHEWYTENNTEEKEFGVACEIIRHQLRVKK
ncbi:DUF4747 family protein [Pseudoxanthomonas mexicana]|uniref:DUF4747 family protein n=1 Tax=Pseudoxanthomonas mexicana TaxID=128785 RepID=UPI001FD71599|nr:DUF4747 family protein [Pseudoxanthomonas mexicana]UOV01634.1 DUF4747 family protein [Pseudoxanthomonas mexicana]